MGSDKTAVKRPGKLAQKAWLRVLSKWDSLFGFLKIRSRQRKLLVRRITSFLQREKLHNGEKEVFDVKRRVFVKYALFGGALFFVGKYIGPVMNMLRGDTVLSEKTFDNFTITETGRQLKVSDNDGEDLLIIDKEEF